MVSASMPVGARTDSSELPEGPRLPRFVQSAAWLFFPARFMEACRAEYGPTFTVRAAGLPPIVVVSDPDAVRTVMTGDPEIFRAGEANAELKPATWLRSFGRQSLFLLDGRPHGRERKLMMTAFRPERLSAYERTMGAIADAWVDRVRPGRPVRLYDEMQRLTLDVLLSTYFGPGALERGSPLGVSVARMLAFGEHSAPLVFGGRGSERRGRSVLERAGRWSPWVALGRSIEEVDGELRAEIVERRRRGSDANGDVLSLLLTARDEDGRSLDDRALLDETRTLLVAGHETTARALTWAVVELVGDERVHARARREAAHGDEYLDAVIQETLRLHPIVPIVMRRLSIAAEVGGRVYPEGTVVAPSIHLAQLDPSAFPEPTRFEPDRFVGTKAGKFEFLPFGQGVRRCLGNAFALLEMRAVLRRVVRANFRFARPPAGKMRRRPMTFAVPKDTEVIRDS